MRSLAYSALYLSLIVLTLAPWAMLLIDGAGLFFVGHAFTTIPWEFNRIIIATLWPFFIVFMVAGMTGAC